MTTSSKAATIVFAAVLTAVLAGCASSPPTGDDLSADATRVADELNVPGIAVEIVDRAGVVERVTHGSDGSGARVTESTPFVWGSVSKSFTALLVTTLASEGRLSLDKPVVQALPDAEGLLQDPSTTVSDLVHHTSGLPHDVTLLDDWGRTGGASDVVAELGVTGGDRGTFRYSSLNYLLLQAIVERTTGEPYADVLRREVLTPLGIDDTIIDADTFGERVPPGHVPFFTYPRSIDIGFDSAGLGYGYLAGSVDDLGTYASAQLSGATSPMDTVPTSGDAEYGSGWYVEQMPTADGTTEVRWHSGAVPGYFTHVALVPERNEAIVLVANRYGELEADRLAGAARSLVESRLGGEPSAIPGSGMYVGILAALGVVALVLVAWSVRTVSRIRRGGERSVRRAVVSIVVGAVVVAAAIYGVPSLIGAPLSILPRWALPRWAPDVALLFWIVVAAIAVTAVVLAVRNRRQTPVVRQRAATRPSIHPINSG